MEDFPQIFSLLSKCIYFTIFIVAIHPLTYGIYFCHRKNDSHSSFKGYCTYFDGRTWNLLVWVFLSAVMFISWTKLVPAMRSFRKTITSSVKILAAMHSFNGTVHFFDVKICNHPILLALFLSAYFKTGFLISPCIELKKSNGGVINSVVGRS